MTKGSKNIGDTVYKFNSSKYHVQLFEVKSSSGQLSSQNENANANNDVLHNSTI